MHDHPDTSAKSSAEATSVFAVVLTAIFLTLSMVNVAHHAMWRDEAHVWEVGAANSSLGRLFGALRYEGAPVLGYGITWVITRMTANLLVTQVVHAIIAAGVVLTFALWAPFGRVMKTLFAFGYFPFFEYSTICRAYGLLFLLFLIAAAIASSTRPRPYRLAMVLVLLSQVSIWGAAFAGLTMTCAALRWTFYAPTDRRRLFRQCIPAGAVVVVACVLAYLQATPGPGGSFILFWAPGTSTMDKLMGSVGTVWKGFVPLPAWEREFWNTNLLDNFYITQFLLACVLLLILIASLLRSPFALLLFMVGLGGQIVFTYFKFCGQTRHHGQLFMVLIVACWLAETWPKRTPPVQFVARVADWFDRRRKLFLGVLLAVHLVAGFGASIACMVLPFSAGKVTAEFIRSLSPNVTLAGVEDYCMAPVAVYLGRDFYFPEERRFAPYNTQDDNARHAVTHESFLDDLRMLTLTRNQDIILLLSDAKLLDPNRREYDLEIPATPGAPRLVLHVTLMGQFTDSTVPDERYSVYRFHRTE